MSTRLAERSDGQEWRENEERRLLIADVSHLSSIEFQIRERARINLRTAGLTFARINRNLQDDGLRHAVGVRDWDLL
jgi:hypothetical protein